MKFLTVIALLSFSLTSFAGLMKQAGEAESTVDKSISAQAQQAELTKIAEGRAMSNLYSYCERSASYYLENPAIGQRNVQTANTVQGRYMKVSALAVGNCVFVRHP